METTTAPRITHIEDAESFGTCAACGRESLRWLVHLTEGLPVGVECAKKVLGFKPLPKSYNWMKDFAFVAQVNDGGNMFALYQHRTRNYSAMTLNGNLHQMGGAAAEWTRRGWAK